MVRGSNQEVLEVDYAQRERNPARHLPSITMVIVLHLALGYALVRGLARKVVEVMKAPLETKIIEEMKKPPPDAPPPPPPKLATPPPPFIPPPEINIHVPITQVAPPITTVTTTPPPPAPPVAAPPACVRRGRDHWLRRRRPLHGAEHRARPGDSPGRVPSDAGAGAGGRGAQARDPDAAAPGRRGARA